MTIGGSDSILSDGALERGRRSHRLLRQSNVDARLEWHGAVEKAGGEQRGAQPVEPFARRDRVGGPNTMRLVTRQRSRQHALVERREVAGNQLGKRGRRLGVDPLLRL